ELTPAASDHIAEVPRDFHQAGRASELLRGNQGSAAAAEQVENNVPCGAAVLQGPAHQINGFHRRMFFGPLGPGDFPHVVYVPAALEGRLPALVPAIPDRLTEEVGQSFVPR